MTFNLLLAFVTLVPLPIEVGWRWRKSRRARGAFWSRFVDFLSSLLCCTSSDFSRELWARVFSWRLCCTASIQCAWNSSSAADKTVYFSLVHWKFTRKENKLVSKSRRIRWDAEVRVEREAEMKDNILMAADGNVWNISVLPLRTHLLYYGLQKIRNLVKLFSSASQTCKRQHVVRLRFSHHLRFHENQLVVSKILE